MAEQSQAISTSERELAVPKGSPPDAQRGARSRSMGKDYEGHGAA